MSSAGRMGGREGGTDHKRERAVEVNKGQGGRERGEGEREGERKWKVDTYLHVKLIMFLSYNVYFMKSRIMFPCDVHRREYSQDAHSRVCCKTKE